MRLLHLLWVAMLLASVGCDRARSLAKNWSGKSAPGKAVPAFTGPVVVELTEANFESFPRKRGRLTLVEYHAEWSGPCRQFSPLLKTLATEYNGLVLVGRVNVDEFQQVVKKERVKDLPDVRIYREGILVERFVGQRNEKELREMISIHAKGLPPLSATGNADGASSGKPMPKEWMPEGMRKR